MVKNVDNFDVNSISENSSIGYILEVDLEHPDELHGLHNDYPLATEKLAISYMLSDYSIKIADEYGILVGDVKNWFQIWITKLIMYLITEIFSCVYLWEWSFHRLLKFKQSDWMKKYIDFNTEKGTNAANSFEKDFFKWMVNSVYGKTMENLRK